MNRVGAMGGASLTQFAHGIAGDHFYSVELTEEADARFRLLLPEQPLEKFQVLVLEDNHAHFPSLGRITKNPLERLPEYKYKLQGLPLKYSGLIACMELGPTREWEISVEMVTGVSYSSARRRPDSTDPYEWEDYWARGLLEITGHISE